MNRLQKALALNAIFSCSTGILLVFFDDSIANLFEVWASSIFFYVGIALIFFSLTIALETIKQRKFWVYWIICQDALWVVGSAIVLIFDPFSISDTGEAIIGVVAFIVAFMGLNQLRALRGNTGK